MFSVFNCFKTLSRRSRKQSRRSQKQEPKPSAVNPVTHRKESIQNSKPASAIPIDDDEVVGTVSIAECAELETVGNSGNPENALTDEPETTGATEEPLEQHDTDEHQPLVERPPNPNVVPGIVVERQATLLAETVATIPSIQRSPSDVSLTPNLSRGNSQTSQSSSRSQPGSKSSSSGRHWLKAQLDLAALESPIHEFCFLIPKSALEELITVTNVSEDIQARDPSIGGPEATSLANKVCRCAPRLYATLAYIKKGADIKGLLAEDVTDDDLPFVRKANDPRKFALYRCNGKAIQTLDLWVDKYLQRFDRHQWWMNAPVFKQNEDLYELDKTTVLPFVNFEPPKGTVRHKQAGYSEVYPVRIHPAHHDFWASSGPVHEEPLVAVKQLYSEDEEEFEKERSILTAMTMKNHPHLIKLLATYKYKGKYHLMFPLANSNLRQYWDDRPKPAFDKETVLWSLQQMAGIANGLLRVHTYKVTHPLSIPGFGNMRVQSDVQLSVKKGEERYGRHGDIKPENVLWFAQNSEAQSSKGILQIADFGLGRFHGRESRSRVPPESVSSSPTYEPPECKLRLPVSRAYDMWSLGCLYLEFITWLLKGTAQIWEFSDFRGGQANPNTIDDDNFFTLTTGTEGQKATVRKQVVTWANDLHGHERCSLLIHDLLDLTMKGLLVVEVSGRYPASWLYFKLEECLKRAEMDEDYVLKPAPRKLMPEPERANTDPGASTLPKTKPKPNSKRNSVVTFADEKPTMKEIVHTTLPRDLVLRKSAMKTWPTHGPQRQTMVVALPQLTG